MGIASVAGKTGKKGKAPPVSRTKPKPEGVPARTSKGRSGTTESAATRPKRPKIIYNFAPDSLAAIEAFRAAIKGDEIATPLPGTLADFITRGELADVKAAVATVGDLERSSGSVSPFFLAVKHGRFAIAHWLMEQGAMVDPPRDSGPAPLHLAVQAGEIALVQAMLARGAAVEARWRYAADQAGEHPPHHEVTPLILAAELSGGPSGEEMVRILLAAGADANASTAAGVTALHEAAPAVIEVLLRHGADPRRRDAHGMTPMMAMYERLLKAQIIVPDDQRGWTRGGARDPAESQTVVATALDRMSDAGGTTDGFRSLDLIDACWHGDEDRVRAALADGADAGYRKSAVLFTAIDRGQADLIGLLVKAGADVNQVGGDFGYSPLREAVDKENMELIKALVEAGADTSGLLALAEKRRSGYVEAHHMPFWDELVAYARSVAR